MSVCFKMVIFRMFVHLPDSYLFSLFEHKVFKVFVFILISPFSSSFFSFSYTLLLFHYGVSPAYMSVCMWVSGGGG